MNTKNKGLMMALAAMAMYGQNNFSVKSKEEYELDQEEKDKKLKEGRNNLLKKKGVKEFIINGVTVYARNYDNALRKANNLKNK